jgi:hypothetical protein
MHFPPVLVAYLASIPTVSAVTIRNFHTGGCRGNYRQCNNIKAYACCDNRNTSIPYYKSSSFQGLATTGVGVLCKIDGGKSCGRIHTTGAPGLNTCLGKNDTAGSFWYDCRQAGTCSKSRTTQLDAEDPAPVQAIERATPDIVGIDDHQFYTNDSTPEPVVLALFGLLSTDITYQEIPSELKKYEKIMSDEELEEEEAQWGN